MSIRDLLASSGAGGKTVNKQTFTATGTWTKPADVLDTDLVVVDIWGAGGSGGITVDTSSKQAGAGGAGGAHNRVQFRAGDLAASEAVTVGAGGLAVTSNGGSGTSLDGNNGGYSEFKGNRAYGGGGGGQYSSSTGTGGGIYSPGGRSVDQIGVGGAPQVLMPYTLGTQNVNVSTQNPSFIWGPSEWGGAGQNPETGGPAIHGGASSYSGSTATKFRSSVWGGGAGGFIDSTGAVGLGGSSQFGGNGADPTVAATNTSNVNGNAGSPRGGGGSGGHKGNISGTVTSGAGGRGEVVITVIRGG